MSMLLWISLELTSAAAAAAMTTWMEPHPPALPIPGTHLRSRARGSRVLHEGLGGRAGARSRVAVAVRQFSLPRWRSKLRTVVGVGRCRAVPRLPRHRQARCLPVVRVPRSPPPSRDGWLLMSAVCRGTTQHRPLSMVSTLQM